MRLLFIDDKSPRRIVACIVATNDEMISTAMNIVDRKAERALWVAVDADVDEVGNGDSFGDGEAGEEGGGGELHCGGWVGSESDGIG
jgi:hypothetical protein